jgi:hypothetical protein
MICKHSIGPWFVTMLQSRDRRLSQRSVDYLKSVSNKFSSGKNGIRRHSSVILQMHSQYQRLLSWEQHIAWNTRLVAGSNVNIQQQHRESLPASVTLSIMCRIITMKDETKTNNDKSGLDWFGQQQVIKNNCIINII